MFKKFSSVEATFSKILASAISISLICLALVIIYNAMVRFLPIDPTQMAWTEEIGRLLLLWLGFVGAGFITREEKHFVIDVFTKRMRARVLLFWRLFSDILINAFLIILVWETIPIIIDQMDQIASGAVEIPLGLFSLSLLAGIIIMLFYAIMNSIEHFRKFREKSLGNSGFHN